MTTSFWQFWCKRISIYEYPVLGWTEAGTGYQIGRHPVLPTVSVFWVDLWPDQIYEWIHKYIKLSPRCNWLCHRDFTAGSQDNLGVKPIVLARHLHLPPLICYLTTSPKIRWVRAAPLKRSPSLLGLSDRAMRVGENCGFIRKSLDIYNQIFSITRNTITYMNKFNFGRVQLDLAELMYFRETRLCVALPCLAGDERWRIYYLFATKVHFINI